MTERPKLLKARQLHSRIFAVAAVLLLLFVHPAGYGLLARQITVWLGYTLVIIGAFGRMYCSAYIGGRKNGLVVRDGPFSVVRNPLYVFSFLAIAGIGLESNMIVLFVILTGAFIIYYPKVVAKEEAFLLHKFGEPYEAYMREVPRWLPNFKLWNEPDLIETKPKFVRRTAMDAAIFFLPLPCFIIIALLQGNHILPVLLRLP